MRREPLAAVWLDAKQRPFGDRATLKYAGKWGFIDRTGRMVAEPEFDARGDYSIYLSYLPVFP
jgi:hypothetical protein